MRGVWRGKKRSGGREKRIGGEDRIYKRKVQGGRGLKKGRKGRRKGEKEEGREKWKKEEGQGRRKGEKGKRRRDKR